MDAQQTAIFQRLSQKYDPNLVRMVAGQFTEETAPIQSPDMWTRGLGMGSEIDAGAARDTAGLARTMLTQGPSREGMTATNVNRSANILAPSNGMPERYASGGGYSRFKSGMDTEGIQLPSDVRPELLYTTASPKDLEIQEKALRGREQALRREIYSAEYNGNQQAAEAARKSLAEITGALSELDMKKELLESEGKEMGLVRRQLSRLERTGVGNADEIYRNYNRLMERRGIPYEKRVELSKKEREAQGTPQDYRATKEGVTASINADLQKEMLKIYADQQKEQGKSQQDADKEAQKAHTEAMKFAKDFAKVQDIDGNETIDNARLEQGYRLWFDRQGKSTAGPEGPGDSEMPDPAQYSGKHMTDTETGKRYRSDGTKWVEVGTGGMGGNY